jgi:hypothetical protein
MSGDAKELTLIVSGAAGEALEESGSDEDFEAQSGALRRAFGFGKPKRVNMETLEKELDRVQDELDTLLAKVKTTDPGGFRLRTVEVSLSISGEGSIGVATIGAEASLSLSFERSG